MKAGNHQTQNISHTVTKNMFEMPITENIKKILVRQNFVRFIKAPIGTWIISSVKWVEKNRGTFVKRLTTLKLVSRWLRGQFFDNIFMKSELFLFEKIAEERVAWHAICSNWTQQLSHCIAGYNWSHENFLLMNLGNTIEIWKR